MAENARRYTISIEVEIRPQDDLTHFQPGSVVASAPQLGIEWVSGNDAAALREFFDFFVQLRIPDGMSIAEYGKSELLAQRREGISAITQRALDDHAIDADEADMAQIAREWADYDRDPPGS